MAHSCYCRSCKPHYFPSNKQGENHLAVRFGDANRNVKFMLNGKGIELISEAISGEHGLVVQYCSIERGDNGRYRLHTCQYCESNTCEHVIHGRVDIIEMMGPLSQEED